MSTQAPFPAPPPGSRYAQAWMIEDLSEQQRENLPGPYHRPYFNGLVKPVGWVCEACWGDGWATQWPCPAALSEGVELAESLGLGYSS